MRIVSYITSFLPVPQEAVQDTRHSGDPAQSAMLYFPVPHAIRHGARKTALGENFDIRAFHDQILGGGAMPLFLLERRIDNWLAENQE